MQLLDRTVGHQLLPARSAGPSANAPPVVGGGQTAAVAAPVLVLLAPGRLHHDPAGDGHGLGHHRDLLAASRCSATSRWSSHRRHRRAGLHRLGPPHVPVGHEPAPGHRLHALDDDDRPARRPSRSSTGWARSGAAASSTPRAMLNAMAFVSMFIIGGLSGIFMAATPVDMLHPRHLLHRRPTSTTCCSAAACSASSRRSTYWFPKMFGRMMNERLGQDPLLPDVHLLQRHVLPDAHHRHAGHPRRYADSDDVPYLEALAAR